MHIFVQPDLYNAQMARFLLTLTLLIGSYKISNAQFDIHNLYVGGGWNAAAMQLHEGEDIVIIGDKDSFITEENGDDMNLSPDRDSIVYSIKLVSKEPDLHYYFYDFKDNYDIKLISHLSLGEPTDAQGKSLIDAGFIGLREEETEDTNRYKLFVTRKPLVNPATLEQTGFPFTKDTTSTIKFASDVNDWFCKSITVTMRRKSEATPVDPSDPIEPVDPNDDSLLD